MDAKQEALRLAARRAICAAKFFCSHCEEAGQCLETEFSEEAEKEADAVTRVALEAAAKVADQIARNAEYRAAGHTNAEAKRAALDKMEAAQEVSAAIRALAPPETEGEPS